MFSSLLSDDWFSFSMCSAVLSDGRSSAVFNNIWSSVYLCLEVSGLVLV